MDPVTGAAAILAATQLLGGLYQSKAAREAQQKQTQMNLLGQAQKLEQTGIQTKTQGQVNALNNLVEAYKSALLK